MAQEETNYVIGAGHVSTLILDQAGPDQLLMKFIALQLDSLTPERRMEIFSQYTFDGSRVDNGK